MLCSKCSKNEANKLNKFFDFNLNKELYFCDNCFKSVNTNNKLSLNEFFESDNKEVHCKFCNTSSKHFLNTGYVGCEECYKSFEDIIMPIVNNIHKSTTHKGKFVSTNLGSDEINEKLKELTIKLQELVKEEEFEKASKVKFEITRLKESLLWYLTILL